MARTSTGRWRRRGASRGIRRDRRRRRPPPSRAVFFERRACAPRSLRAGRTGAWHRSPDRRSARPILARAVAAAALVSPAWLIRGCPETQIGLRARDALSRGRDPPPRSRVQHVFRRPLAASALGDARARWPRSSRSTIRAFIRNTADRFRFESLQNRYQKFLELVGTADDQPRAWPPDHRRAAAGRCQGEATKHKTREQEAEKRQGQEKRASRKRPTPRTSASSAIRNQVRTPIASRSSSSSWPTRRRQAGEAPVTIDRVAALVKAQVEKFECRRTGRDLQGRPERRQGVADGEAGEGRPRQDKCGWGLRTRTDAGREPGTGWIKR